jgi:group I intron endonuclease
MAIYFRESELLKSPRPIHKALLKYGYDNFILEILEVLPKNGISVKGTLFKAEIIKREQYYLDLLEPEYNILKTAYSMQGYKHTESTKLILKALAVKRAVAV